MHIPSQFSLQLKKLCLLAKDAKDDYEKAAVFSATELYVAHFVNGTSCEDAFIHRVLNIKFHIHAALGYASVSGYHSHSHVDWALSEIELLLPLSLSQDKLAGIYVLT